MRVSQAGKSVALRVVCPSCGAVALKRCYLLRALLPNGRIYTNHPHQARRIAALAVLPPSTTLLTSAPDGSAHRRSQEVRAAMTLRISVDAEGQLIERWVGDRWWLYQNSAEGIVNGRIVL